MTMSERVYVQDGKAFLADVHDREQPWNGTPVLGEGEYVALWAYKGSENARAMIRASLRVTLAELAEAVLGRMETSPGGESATPSAPVAAGPNPPPAAPPPGGDTVSAGGTAAAAPSACAGDGGELGGSDAPPADRHLDLRSPSVCDCARCVAARRS